MTDEQLITVMRKVAYGCEATGRWLHRWRDEAIDNGGDTPGKEDQVPFGYYDEESLHPDDAELREGEEAPPLPEGVDAHDLDVYPAILARGDDGVLFWLEPVWWEPYTLEEQQDQLNHAASVLRQAAARLEELGRTT